jgi:hypothetical protein
VRSGLGWADRESERAGRSQSSRRYPEDGGGGSLLMDCCIVVVGGLVCLFYLKRREQSEFNIKCQADLQSNLEMTADSEWDKGHDESQFCPFDNLP